LMEMKRGRVGIVLYDMIIGHTIIVY
jgi:hypothetical protein